MKYLTKWTAVVLLFVGLVLLNFIAGRVGGKLDFTAAQIYTLSDGTHEILDEVEEPVTLKFFFSRSLEGVPIMFKNYAQRVEELLEQYESASNGMVQVEVIDPKPDTEEEEAAIRYGLNGQPVPPVGDTLFFGLVAIQADQEEIIPIFTPQREPFLEYDITRAIWRVQQLTLPRIGILTTLPMFGSGQPPMPGRPPQPGAQPWAVIQELQRDFDVVEVDAESEGGLPDDLDALAIIHPQGLPVTLQWEIDQFLLSGKPVLVAVDPVSQMQRANMPQQQMMMGGTNLASELPTLLPGWGITYSPRRVVGDLANAAMVGTGRGQPVRLPTWLQLTEELNPDMPITGELDQVLIVEGGAFSVEPQEGLEFTPLIVTSDETGMVETNILGFTPPEEIGRQITPDGVVRNIAGIFRGTFPTAFPDGKPFSPEASADEVEAAQEADFLAQSSEPGTLVLFADVDFMGDQFSVQRFNLFGQMAMQPINSNLALMQNAVEALSGDSALMSLRGKGTEVRPFTRVAEIERSAQEQYQAQLEALDQQLQQIQTQLRQLQTEQQEAGNLVASPEVVEAIENYRLQEAEMRGERREIRKKLREDIEALERSLAMLNLLAVPLLIAVFGVGFFYRRHQRQRSS